MQSSNRQNALEAWIVAAVLAVAWLALGWRTLDQGRSHDFLSFYTGAYMTSHNGLADLYDPAAQFAAQRKLAPLTPELVPFIRPPFNALLLAPLGRLPFGVAFAGWILLQISVLIACLAWAWRRFGTPALLFACMSMPAALGIAHGQDAVLFLAVLIVSYRLIEKGSDFSGGVVLGMLLVKPHLALLWPVALVIERRFKTLAGFAATGVAAAAVSLAMIGAGGVRSYAQLLRNPDLTLLSPSPEFMIGLEGLGANFGMASLAAYAAMAAVIVALFLIAVRQAPLWRVFAATTAASLLVAPHAYGYDATMLLLGLWLTTFSAALQPTRIVALWLFTPLAYGFTLAGKPWAAVSSLSLLALVVALACEAHRHARQPFAAAAMRGEHHSDDPAAEARSPL